MKEQLPPAIKRVWASSAVLSGLLGLIITAGLWWAYASWQWWLWLPVTSLVLTGFDVVVELALIPYRYAFWRYQITANAVHLQRGVVFKEEVTVPITRIQNVILEAGPLLQLNKLQAVKVETAASSYQIDGVVPETANALRDRIMTLAREARDESI